MCVCCISHLYQSLSVRPGALFCLPLINQQFPLNFSVPVAKKSANQPVQLWLAEPLVSAAVQCLCVATNSVKALCVSACITWLSPVHNSEVVHG